MKAALLCLLALTAVAAVSSSASMHKVNMGASLMSGMVRRTLMGRQEDCDGFCLVHLPEPHGCALGAIHAVCEDDEISIGTFEDGCHCCVFDFVSGE